MKKVGIIGGTGYTGGELARLLCRHPGVELAAMTSRQNAGRRVSDVLPWMRGYADFEFVQNIDEAPDLDLVFVATPQGVAMTEVPGLLEAGVKAVDLSGDYRLKDPAEYEKWYGREHTDADNLPRAVYGLPELFRDRIAGADLVANPGCYATSAILACAPVMKSGLVGTSVVVDSKSGTSGAGMVPSPATHHATCSQSVSAYGVGTHRHTPEMVQAVREFSGEEMDLTFVPHLVPVVRGILSDCYFDLDGTVSQGELEDVYDAQYGSERFVHRVDEASMRDVAGSNHAEVACRALGGKAVAFCALDNLVKGASGQAVQCMNLMLGMDEGAGLDFPGLGVRSWSR